MKFLVCSRLSEHRYKTPEGYLVCVDSILSRTGKQTYSCDELFKDGCNDEVEVERSAEEVFSEKTLASFENKPLTIEHPEEDVTPANHNKYSVGFIRDIKRGKDGSEDVMLGTIVVTDAEAIELIETGKLKELSCGYDCDIEDEDNPQQRNIRGNHVALCEKGRAGIARIVDSIKDEQSSKLGDKVRFRNRVYVIIKVQKGKSDDVARLTLRPLERFDEKDKPFEGGGDSYWDIRIERWQLDDSCKDSIKDVMFEICYIDDDGDVCIAIEAKNENDARQKFRRRYGMYYIKHIRKVKDGVKDMKVSHDNIREQPVFVMQSDVDKNLFFYIGKTHAMKEGEWTYTQYDMEGMTPDELRKELEANGWHKVARGPAPFIDEDPYKKSTEGLEEAEKNLHDEMLCNTDTDCKDASDNAYRKVQMILSKNPQFKGKVSKKEFDTGEIMIDFEDYRNADKFVAECRRAGLKCREGYFGPDTTILVRDSVKDKHLYSVEFTRDGDELSDYISSVNVYANSEQEAITKAKLWAREKYEYSYNFKIIKTRYTNVETIDSVKDEQIYPVEFCYTGDSWSDYLGHVNVRAKSEQEALTKAERWAREHYDNAGHFRICKTRYTNVETIDSVDDAKTEYIFNYRDAYHGTRDKMRVDANNLDEAIREFGKTMALGGFGTANIYVVSVSPNDGYMRAYGKLSEMLKQKWTRDSAKKLDSKKILSIVRAAKSVKK